MLPDVQEYSAAEQDAAALELETYGAKMPVVAGKMIPDYGLMRKQTRAAKTILK